MVQGGAWVLEGFPVPLVCTEDEACGLGLLPAPRPWSSALRISVFIC